MKHCILFLLAVLFVSCGTTKLAQSGTNVDPAAPEGLKATISAENFSSGATMGSIMNFLASDDLKGRDSGSEGIAEAATYIEEIFKKYDINPYFDSYRDTLSNFTKPAYNIVGLLEGNDTQLKEEYIIIGAHYDHIGIVKPKQDSTATAASIAVLDSIANGANDNASGTSTVLELARYFGSVKNNKRSLLFVLFSAEEKGLLGSRHLAERLKAENMDLYTVLNFEMTGVPMIDKDYFLYVTGYNKSNLAEVSNKYAEENLVGFLETAEQFNLFQRSDNYPFHEVFNVPSQTFCTFDFTNFNHYHKVGDEVSTLDLNHMAKVVNKLIPVIEGITNAATKEIKYQ